MTDTNAVITDTNALNPVTKALITDILKNSDEAKYEKIITAFSSYMIYGGLTRNNLANMSLSHLTQFVIDRNFKEDQINLLVCLADIDENLKSVFTEQKIIGDVSFTKAQLMGMFNIMKSAIKR